MSEISAAKGEEGAHQLVDEAERMLQQAVGRQRPGAAFSFPNTVYYLPIILGSSAKAVEKLGDLRPALYQARKLLERKSRAPGTASNAGQAALLAAEIIEALHSPDGHFDSRISDSQVRSWGVQLADGRIPGIALLMGSAKNNCMTVKLVEGLRQYNILCLLSASAHAGGLWRQLKDAGFETGSASYIVPLGNEPTSAVHALGFAARCAMKLGGHKPGMWTEILAYAKRRTPGFVLALGELEERDYAMLLAAAEFGFTAVTDAGETDVMARMSTTPGKSEDGEDDAEKAGRLREKCVTVRGLKPKAFDVGLPVPYGPSFEEEVIGDEDLQVEFGGADCRAFELLLKAEPAEVIDGKVEVIGEGLPGEPRAHMDLGIIIKVTGEKVQADFEPYLERQIHDFLNYASGVQYTGRQDRASIRISRAAAAKGLSLELLGKLLYTRFHAEFGKAIDKVEVTLITEPKCHAEWLEKARAVYATRKKRLDGLKDDEVDVFYACTHCRTFAPNNVSIITPERVSPCGECSWLDAKASYELDVAGFRRPIKPGKAIDVKKGIWEGTNQYAKAASHGRMGEVALYSIMQTPMGACGDFECMVILIPEANGVMVLSHEDTSRATPAGLTIETFASLTAGEQIPGVVGIGKSHLLSPKFILPEGGFRRVVWMSSRLKESMTEELQAVCEREGAATLMEKIADERQVTTVEQLVRWLNEHKHPALEMEKMF